MDRQSDRITALYCRMAHYSEMSTTCQMEALFQYASDHKLKNPHFYCDWGCSGHDVARPQYRLMLRDIEAGNVSDLVVLNMSRLGRDYRANWILVEHILPKHGVEFHSIQDGDEVIEARNKLVLMMKKIEIACCRSQEGGQG